MPVARSLSGMTAVGRDEVQAAFDAGVGGDLGPLVDLLGPDLEWRGIERGHWLWKRAPS